MKKLSRFFAIILSVCILVTGLAIAASAITNADEISDAYTSQLKPSKATNAMADTDANSIWGASTNLNSHSTNEKVTVNGNTYLNLRYTDAAGEVNTEKAGYRELALYTKKNTVGANPLVYKSEIKNQVAILDFDFCPDRYVVTDSSGSMTTYTPDNLPLDATEANTDLSIINGSSILFLLGYWTTDPATTDTVVTPSTSGKYIYMNRDDDGTWWYQMLLPLTPLPQK